MKRNRFFFIVLFFFSLFLLSAFTFLLPTEEFSQIENRVLAQKPHFSYQEMKDGQFQTGLSDFLSDQVPFRTMWIKANTKVQKLTGRKEINEVYLGKDHYYFQKFTDQSYSTSRMMGVFRMIEGMIQKQSVPVTMMLVPSPGTVLSDKLPGNAPYYQADLVYDTAKQLLSCKILDLRETFRAHAADTQLYYRTDHHWTSQGAYLAYEEYCKLMGMEPRQYNLQEVSKEFYGTIYSKVLDGAAKPDSLMAPVDLPKMQVTYDNGTQSDSFYHEEFLQKKDKYAYFFGGNWGKVTIKTEAPTKEKLLIIKDSFANSFVPYLLGDYAEITMLDLRYFKGNVENVIQESGSTQILFLYETSNFLTDTGIVGLEPGGRTAP